MQRIELQNKIDNKKIVKGRFYPIVYVSVYNGCTKITHTNVRFVEYYNKKEVIEQGKIKDTSKHRDYIQTIIENVLIHNTNTNKDYLQVNTCPNSKVISRYFDPNHKEIDKETYYQLTGKKPSKPTNFFTITLDNVVSIG